MDIINKLEKWFTSNKFNLNKDNGKVNIIYIEGINTNFQLNDDEPNIFNDVRLILAYSGGIGKITGCWEATSEPGSYYTYNPMNPLGCARIKFGQYKAWQVGTHGNSEPHEALIQVGEVSVHRDLNKDFIRLGDKVDTGLFGINQHYGYDLPHKEIGKASAGCLVGRFRKGHREFMSLIKQDIRYVSDKGYVFESTIIPGDKLYAE